MKKVILFLLFIPVIVSAQISENFESGSVENWVQGNDDRWIADTASSISGNFSLRHAFDNSMNGTDCIGLPLKDLHPEGGVTKWSFVIRHGSDPSSSNKWSVYLLCNTDPVSIYSGKEADAFVIGVNLMGYDDTLRLWKVRGGDPSVVISCPLNWQNDIGPNTAAEITVERSSAGLWKISVTDRENGNTFYSSGNDRELFKSDYLVIKYVYTSSRDRLLWLDDLEIEGVFYKDTTPPAIINCKVSSVNSTDIVLSEEPSSEILTESNYSLENSTTEVSDVLRISPFIYRLIFKEPLQNKTSNYLIINSICDLSGNCSDNMTFKFTPVWAEPGDVVISEIMADPVPSVALPDEEYIEIFNRSEFPFNLENWELNVDGRSVTIPPSMIDPGEYVILCSWSDTLKFSGFGSVIGLKTFPVLSDAGKIIVISDSMGNLINGVDYSSSWYGNVLKKEGGWSLEIMDVDFPFFGAGNWKASESRKGGTPGQINSISGYNPDRIFYGIKNAFPEDSVTIRLTFTEPVLELEGSTESICVSGSSVISISSSDPLRRQFIIKSAEPFVKGLIYSLNFSNDITDFAGNQMTAGTFQFGIPEPAEKEDVVFNELLFNPLQGDADFIEFFNISDRIVDVSSLFLASVDTESGDTSDVKQVFNEGRCLLPGSFFVVTGDREKIADRYISSDPAYIFNIISMPSMPDDQGHLLLLNREMDMVDEVIYSDKMHYSLLKMKEGISLEKIRPGLSSNRSSSWHSASESSGWATPGLENSAYTEETEKGDQLIFSSGKITPDNDGNEDVLIIDFNSDDPGNMVTITIFNETGNRVRKLKENFYAGNSVSVIWDGTSEDGNLVNTGIYIFLIELYDEKGKTKAWKKVCAVIRK